MGATRDEDDALFLYELYVLSYGWLGIILY